VGPRGGPGPLHEQLAVGAPVAGHQVVILSRAGPRRRRRRRKSKQPALFQMLVGHCGRRAGEELKGGEGGRGLKLRRFSMN